MTITTIIKKYLLDNGLRQKELASLLGESEPNLNKKLARNDLDTAFLKRISVALRHDFFADLSRVLKEEEPAIRTDGKPPADDRRYVQLLEENLQLHRDLKKCNEQFDSLKTGSTAATQSIPKLKTRK